MATKKTFDFKNYIVTVAGIPIQDYAPDEGFTIEWDEDWWTDDIGVDGSYVRSFSNDFRATGTLKLRATSDSNQQLTGLLLIDSAAATPKTNTTTFPVGIASILPNGSKFLGNGCFITKPPSITGSKEAPTYEWPVRFPELLPIITGV